MCRSIRPNLNSIKFRPVWNDIVFDSYKIIDDPKDLDWDKTDIIERHDHQVEWAAEAYDE